jgi:O-antigen biosynthesis protein WbqP
MKRSFDIILSVLSIFIFIFPMLVISILILLTSKGPILYFSDRVGRNSIIFRMPKFRSMKINAPVVATHLFTDSDKHLSPIGGFIRKSSLDELPQLFSIIKGDMSFVGPRPALFNQQDLIDLRAKKGLDKLIPGLTGWAQVNGRDEISIPDKVKLELEYMENKSFLLDLKILWMTFLKVFKSQDISH